jgi:hypothetical protein
VGTPPPAPGFWCLLVGIQCIFLFIFSVVDYGFAFIWIGMKRFWGWFH